MELDAPDHWQSSPLCRVFMALFEVKPQKHSDHFPYDGGWAVWRLDENQLRQCGWFKDKARADARVAELEEQCVLKASQ
jgi:hypothetical protein